MKPIYKSTLNSDQIKKALRLITLVTEKRCGRVKGRACADGRPQRKYIPREEATSPAVGLESLFLSLLVDSHEGRNVATADIVGAYLKADMPELVLIRFSNEEVDIMCEVCPEFKRYVAYEGGYKVLYMQLNKALYGCI